MAGACLAPRRGAGRALCAALAAALLASGCGDDDTAPEAPGSAAKPAPAPDTAVAAPPPARAAARTSPPAAEPPRPAPATVVLLEAGRKPRRALRYKLPRSYRDALGMTIRVGMEVGSGADAVKVDLPVIRLAMKVAAAGKSADNTFRFELTDADVMPGDKMFAGMHDQLVAQMKKAVGAAGTLVVDPRGVNREVSLQLPADMDPQMSESMRWSRQAMEQMSAPLPEEPVGVGARWQVEQLVQLNGLSVVQRTEFELTALRGARASLKTTITQRADPQIVAMPGVPAGFKAELLSHSGKGTGRIDLELTRLVPRKSTVRLETETSLRITGQGQDQPMQTRARAEVTVGRR